MAARARHLRIVVRQPYKYRGDMSWHVVKRYPRRPGEKEGRKEIVAEGFEDRAHAEQLARMMRRRLVVQTDDRLTITDLVAHYLEYARQRDRKPLGAGALALNTGYLENHIGPSEFGRRVPEELADGDLRRFMVEVRGRLGPDGTTNVLKLLRAAFRWARDKGRIREDAAAPIASLIGELRDDTGRGRATPYERHEVENLLRKAEEIRPWLYPILRLLFSTGMRRGEVLGLQWDDVDWPRKRLHLARQISPVTLRPERLKGRKKREHRLIDVPPGAMEMLESLRAEARAGVPWVFATSNGTHYHPSNVNRAYNGVIAALQEEQRRLKKTPIQRLKLHATRHTFASLAFADYMDPNWVSRQLGHYSTAFTLDTYVHLLSRSRSLAPVDFGDVDTSGHKPDTRTQRRGKKDDRLLH